MKNVEFGRRFFLPVLVRESVEKWNLKMSHFHRDTGAYRKLWVYILDPSSAGLKDQGVQLDVRYEPLLPGPVGARFRVSAEVSPKMFEYLDWSKNRQEAFAKNPLSLDDLEMAISGGLKCTTGNPHFAAQMTYAVCQHVYQTFTQALGREPTFGPWQTDAIDRDDFVQLQLRPYAFDEENAYYNDIIGTLEFGFFRVEETDAPLLTRGSIQQYALSHDIISHELTHAILDGQRAHFLEDTNLDVAAFHEGFADLIALLHHYSSQVHVSQVIEETGGIGVGSLLDLGRLLGESKSRSGGSAIRSAIAAMTKEAEAFERSDQSWGEFERRSRSEKELTRSQLVYTTTSPVECHERGGILVVAVLEAFLVTFRKRARIYRRLAGIIHPSDSKSLPAELTELLTIEVNKLADHFLTMLIRAVDYCPPVDLTFGEFLRALITADLEMMPSDKYDYRGALIRAFRRRGIHFENVLDISQESLRWGAPDDCVEGISGLAFADLRLNNEGTEAIDKKEMERWAEAFSNYIHCDPKHFDEFGLTHAGGPYQPIVIESINIFSRLNEIKQVRRGLVIEVTQTRISTASTISGGCTVILDHSGIVKYVIRKRVNSLRRRQRQVNYRRGRAGNKIRFSAIHKEGS